MFARTRCALRAIEAKGRRGQAVAARLAQLSRAAQSDDIEQLPSSGSTTDPAVVTNSAAAPAPAQRQKPTWLQKSLGGFGQFASAVEAGERNFDTRVQMPAVDYSTRDFRVDRGTIDHRWASDERFLSTRFRPTAAAKSTHDAAPGWNRGTLERMRRDYLLTVLTPEYCQDMHVMQRFTKRAVESWGEVIPLLWQLRFANKSVDVRRGQAGSVAITTKTLDKHIVPVAAKSQVSAEQLRRQFRLELGAYADGLLRTVDTTATVPLIARFLALHTELGIPVPTEQDVARERAAGRTTSSKHRDLVTRATARLSKLLDDSAIEGADVAASRPTSSPREAAWAASEIQQFLDFAAASSSGITGSSTDESRAAGDAALMMTAADRGAHHQEPDDNGALDMVLVGRLRTEARGLEAWALRADGKS